MKDNDLWVSVKRAETETTKSLQGEKPWSNLLENVEVSHQDQVWVGDITYVRLKCNKVVYSHSKELLEGIKINMPKFLNHCQHHRFAPSFDAGIA